MSDARELIRELLKEALEAPNGNGSAPPVYPPPPVAAVHRPSTWAAPAAEPVRIQSDEDLDRFVHALLARCEDPAQREAIRAGRLRFTLGGAPAAAGGAAARAAAGGHAQADGAVRVSRGAVTERKVEEAARAGARLVLGPGAVLTPLAREKARAKGIAIEREP
jgi:hypothetical protein